MKSAITLVATPQPQQGKFAAYPCDNLSEPFLTKSSPGALPQQTATARNRSTIGQIGFTCYRSKPHVIALAGNAAGNAAPRLEGGRP